MPERSTHEKRAEAGRMGGEAPHECRGRGCTHPSHQRGSSSESTHEKLSEAGKKGAAAEPREAKVKGGKH